jgi:hypothetical protein
MEHTIEALKLQIVLILGLMGLFSLWAVLFIAMGSTRNFFQRRTYAYSS